MTGFVPWVIAAGFLATGPTEERLVDVPSLIPSLVVDLRYATPDNFLKHAVYPSNAQCLLRESVAKRLARVATALEKEALRLKIYDCYRPLAVQVEMWKIFPHEGYVANPSKGGNHNRGAAVDLTLVDADGKELEMPTPFDTFSKAAHHGSPLPSKVAQGNRDRLLDAMKAEGFRPNPKEWWHYDAPNAKRFSVLDQPFPSRP